MGKKKSRKSVSFEESMQQLKGIVADLEAGDLTLADSLKKYEQGIAKLKLCHEALAEVQQKIEVLVDLDEDGTLVTEAFDHTESAAGTPRVRRSQSINVGQPDDEMEPGDDGLEDVDDQLDEAYPDGLF